MMRKAVVATMVALAVSAGACSTLGRAAFKQPDVRVEDVKITGLGLTGGSLDVLLNVSNPNEFRLDASKLTYTVLFDSVQFANGQVTDHFTVDGSKTTQVRVPVNFTYAGIGAAGGQLLQTGTINYTVRGEVSVATPVGNFTVPYTSTGRFSNISGR